MSDGLPPDPWVTAGDPHSAALDGARLLRFALTELESVEAVLAAVAVLSEDECRLIALELALTALLRPGDQGV